MSTLQQNFIQFCIDSKVLRFGEFKTKAGRLSPYFFNAGLFNTGSMLHTLSDFYAKTLIAAIDTGRVKCDMVFGPAYKGIPLGCAVAIRMAELGRDLPFAFNRKEAKDHGEGGSIVGAPLQGNVVIIDDVISAGTSVRESVDLIRANGAVPSGVAETIKKKSAVQEVEERYGIPVCSIASLKDLMSYLKNSEATEIKQYEKAIEAYRRAYGA